MASVGHRGVGGDMPASAIRSLSDRHGIAERGDREPDRSSHRPRSLPPNRGLQFIGFNAVGPEETMDWLAALENVTNRIDTLERQINLQTQSVTTQRRDMEELQGE